ncbi:DUF4183 domain-containing protein [Niallia sp. FSL W8-0635]|uniref:DUF4183 domain-containing protein n=1 Tax=Niallia sp. FSL W8-0635 TaxID=2975337 RepID=UPI0009CA573D|nr:Uncharacterised protein [Mycobacteroides abscessus subsp. abscessus]HEO8422406.1 DUF4183 domain-containing protein [Yersinia enterocolitica]
MPLQIMKLAVSASLSIDTAPTVDRFFYIVTEPITGEGTITIPAADFMTDTGADGATLPELTADNSYLNVYVNGVLQMDDLIAYTPGGTDVGQLIITVPGDSSVIADTPVVLEITNFAPTSETTITT